MLSKKILVIDDVPEEREKARSAVEAAGYEAIIKKDIRGLIAMLPSVDGILTDRPGLVRARIGRL